MTGGTREKLTVDDLNTLRKQVGEAAKYDRNGDVSKNMIAEANGHVYGVLRQTIDDIADKVGQQEILKETNRKIWLGLKIQPFLEAAEIKAGKKNMLQLRDYMAAGVAAAGNPLGTAVALGRLFQKGMESELGKSAQLIYAVKSAERKLDKAVNDSVRSFFLNVGKGAKASTLKLSTDAKEYDAYTKKVQEYASNPNAYLDHVSKRDIGLNQQLPTVVASAQGKGLQAMNFLNSKLPKPATSPGMIPRKYVPSTQQRAQFMRYAEIIEDPKKALQHFQSGTLSRENVEALQAVYPEFYKKLINTASEYMGLHGDKLPYSKKIQLGLLMGVPTDVSMQPQFIQSMQAGFATPNDNSMIQPGVTGASKLDKAGRYDYSAGDN
jgi:hypothetical protein